MISKIRYRLISIILNIKKCLFRKHTNYIDEKVTYSKYQYDLFLHTKPGDLLYCDMPLSEDKLSRIEKGHRSRPYLIVDKKDNYLYGYYCSSTLSKKNIKGIYTLIHNKYQLHKKDDNYNDIPTDTYINLYAVHQLNINHLRSYMTSIDEYDQIQINKIISSINNTDLIKFPVNQKVYISEVYSYNSSLYYVYNVIDDYIACYKLKTTQNSDEDTIYVNKHKYKLDLKQMYKLKVNDCCLYSLNDISLKYKVDKIIKRYINSKNKKRKYNIKNNPYVCKYPIGTLYTNYYDDRLIVYLYSRGKKDYGFDYKQASNFDYLGIENFKLDYNRGALLKVDDDFMCDVINCITDTNPKLYDYFDSNYVFDDNDVDGYA